MEYKIIATDFDGTLLTSDKKISEKTYNILKQLKDNNYIIVGVTARNLSSVEAVCDINMFNYVIINNGTYLYDVENKKGIYIKYLGLELAKKIVEFYQQHIKSIDFCSAEKYYRYKANRSEFNPNLNYNVFVDEIDEIKDIVARINIFFKDNENIEEYINDIPKRFDMVECFAMQDTDKEDTKKWVVVNPKGLNKLAGLEYLCNELNISKDQVIFFGDSGNDLEIIEHVGLGVAVDNALDKVKEKAKKVTLSNDEDGLAVFLEELLNLNK